MSFVLFNTNDGSKPRSAPHPAVGHPLPAAAGRGASWVALRPACGEKVPEGRMRGARRRGGHNGRPLSGRPVAWPLLRLHAFGIDDEVAVREDDVAVEFVGGPRRGGRGAVVAV